MTTPIHAPLHLATRWAAAALAAAALLFAEAAAGAVLFSLIV